MKVTEIHAEDDQELQITAVPATSHRARRTLLIGVAAAGAYLAGTNSGRRRFREMRDWLVHRKELLFTSQPDVLQDEGVDVSPSDVTTEPKKGRKIVGMP